MQKEEEHTITIRVHKSDVKILDNNKDIYESQKGVPIPQVISHRDYPKNKKRELTITEWENLKNILDRNKDNYLERCLWILKQIK